MHAIQTSGNCIRNVTADHLAGIAPDEVEDPRPWCEYIRQWATLHPEFSFLPRKFKIAVTGSPQDRAASKVHDIGLHLVRNAQGEVGFEVLVGGGLGRAPMIGHVIREFLPKHDCLAISKQSCASTTSRVAATTFTRRASRFSSKRSGRRNFARWSRRSGRLRATPRRVYDAAEFARIKAFFMPPATDACPTKTCCRAGRPSSATGISAIRSATRSPDIEPSFVSLKSPTRPPGDMTDVEMDRVADLADQYSFGMIRSTHDQNLMFADVRQRDLFEVWKALKAMDLATPNIGTLTDMICCPGLDFCSLANATVDSDREADQRALRQPRLPLRLGRHRTEDVGLHERLRSSFTSATSAFSVSIRAARSGTRSRSAARRAVSMLARSGDRSISGARGCR